VRSFAELKRRHAADPLSTIGKIIVFNQQCDWAAKPTKCYGETVVYRGSGADAAAAVGGVAALVRSVAAFSINSVRVCVCFAFLKPFVLLSRNAICVALLVRSVTVFSSTLINTCKHSQNNFLSPYEQPHTGVMHYSGKVAKVPTACVTIEDAAMLDRMQARGNSLSISLFMGAENFPRWYVQSRMSLLPIITCLYSCYYKHKLTHCFYFPCQAVRQRRRRGSWFALSRGGGTGQWTPRFVGRRSGRNGRRRRRVH
jgi:hypothetical protein